MSTPQMLSSDRYFEIREERIQRDKHRQIERLTDEQRIVQMAGIEAAELYQKGVVAQLRDDLKKGLANLEQNQWVSWIMLIPAGATQTQDRTETMSGYVISKDLNSGRVKVRIQCNPEVKVDGYEYDKEVSVPMSSITQVMQPQPVVESGPTYAEAKGPAFGKGKAGEFVKGGI